MRAAYIDSVLDLDHELPGTFLLLVERDGLLRDVSGIQVRVLRCNNTTSCDNAKWMSSPRAAFKDIIMFCWLALDIDSESNIGSGCSGRWLLVTKNDGEGCPMLLSRGIAHLAVT